ERLNMLVMPGDPPLLQKQLHTSKSGIQQIIECFRSGTAELKRILLKEVDTIFECRQCRSLFRGLPNLVTHKEFYCFTRPNETDDTCPEKQCQAVNELLKAIYPQTDMTGYTVQLEPIEGNQNAVFQTLTTEHNQNQHAEQNSSKQEPATGPVSSPNAKSLSRRHLLGPKAKGQKPSYETCVEPKSKCKTKRSKPAPSSDEEEECNKEGTTSKEEKVRISCCLCGKEFSTRRSVGHHCLKVHKKNIEELRKCTETHTVPVSLVSIVQNQSCGPLDTVGYDCSVCNKSFTTEVGMRRHFDKEHHSLPQDAGGDVATKPGKLILRKTTSATSSQQDSCPQAENRRCSMCKRTFKTEWVLSRHMRVFHKINAVKKRSSLSQRNSSSKLHKSKLELVFDLEQHYCKLCKRQFSSRANLNKHIGLHLDGNNLFIKFFPCPQCSYETRRKRDVLRHLSVVHKKPSHYLEKVTARLDSQVIKKPASVVLKLSKKRAAKQVAATSVTRSGALATRKREVITRSSSTLEATKVRVTKDLSLYTCDLCGRAFARKSHLQSHRRSHRAPSLQEQSGRRTRSKADLW
uniref:Zinc finger protein 800a n=1 Tax=Scleropages formosus TaxID=113540 RepID=A0A8C9T8E8_SCLFO